MRYCSIVQSRLIREMGYNDGKKGNRLLLLLIIFLLTIECAENSFCKQVAWPYM